MNDKILIVDDEEHILKACQRILVNEPYQCITLSSPLKALEKVTLINPSVVISDQRMPEMEGSVFLEKIKKKLPGAVRVTMTGYADINATIGAINKGHVFRFIKKPWDDLQFKLEIRHAVELFHMTERLRSFSEKKEPGESVNRERLQGVLEMAGAVCHEFAQPLQVISGYNELLLQDRDSWLDIESTHKYLSCIQDEVKKLNDLLLKVMTIQEYKTRAYLKGREIIDIHNASSVENIPYRIFNANQ